MAGNNAFPIRRLERISGKGRCEGSPRSGGTRALTKPAAPAPASRDTD